MAISAISSPAYASQTRPQTTPQAADEIINEFLAYMKESPAEHMRDQWLKEHNLTDAQLAAMPPAQREAINKEIADDIKKKIEQQAKDKVEFDGAISF